MRRRQLVPSRGAPPNVGGMFPPEDSMTWPTQPAWPRMAAPPRRQPRGIVASWRRHAAPLFVRSCIRISTELVWCYGAVILTDAPCVGLV
jgi:hypothetical protein